MIRSTGKRCTSRALTLVETLAAVVALAVILFALLLCTGPGRARAATRQVKCSTQLRGIVMAMNTFTNTSDGRYTLPSRFDPANATVVDVGRAKDTTANIFSVLVFHSCISPEMLVSPSESNSAIKVHTGYQNVNPAAAVDPAKAAWDPSLNADFTAGPAHISYATMMTDGVPDEKKRTATGRLGNWENNFRPDQPCMGNRGPLVTGRDAEGIILHDTRSHTLSIHGRRTMWEGNIVYNDTHAAFEQLMDPVTVTYPSRGGKACRDILFYDEPDDAGGLNAFLGVWIKAGTLPVEFKGIHD